MACRNCLPTADAQGKGGTVFGYHVADPERYGVVAFDRTGKVGAIIEKPEGAAVELCGDRALLPGRHAPRTGARRQAIGAGRAGDHDLLEIYLAEGS